MKVLVIYAGVDSTGTGFVFFFQEFLKEARECWFLFQAENSQARIADTMVYVVVIAIADIQGRGRDKCIIKTHLWMWRNAFFRFILQLNTLILFPRCQCLEDICIYPLIYTYVILLYFIFYKSFIHTYVPFLKFRVLNLIKAFDAGLNNPTLRYTHIWLVE